MTAYFYKLQERETGRIYVGCQYGATADPKNLLVGYKTSCRYVKDRGIESFDIVRILVRDDARVFERRYLRRMYAVMGYELFTQVFINRNLAPGIIFTKDVRERMSASLKITADRKRLAGTLLPTFLGKSHTQYSKNLISLKAVARIRTQGHPRGMRGKHHTESTKERIRQACVNNSAMKGRVGEDHPTGGTSWWNNGILHKRSVASPGCGWHLGRIFKERKRQK